LPPAWVIALIVVAVLAWGIFHAIGAYSLNHNPWRAVMVLACVAGFLGFWGAMLAARRARLRRESQGRRPPHDSKI
jgi:4-amino-4-deoxy-L-arabinose transferase-like glycosyltransferase